MNPRIRIRTKISWIRNTLDFWTAFYVVYVLLPRLSPPSPPHAKLRLGSKSGSGSTLNGKSDPDPDRHPNDADPQQRCCNSMTLSKKSNFWLTSWRSLAKLAGSGSSVRGMDPRIRIRTKISLDQQHWIYGLHSMFYVVYVLCLGSVPLLPLMLETMRFRKAVNKSIFFCQYV